MDWVGIVAILSVVLNIWLVSELLRLKGKLKSVFEDNGKLRIEKRIANYLVRRRH